MLLIYHRVFCHRVVETLHGPDTDNFTAGPMVCDGVGLMFGAGAGDGGRGRGGDGGGG